jgi:serine/threonine protein kinase
LLTPGTKLSCRRKSFKIVKKIAEGGMGICHLASDGLGNKFIVKEPKITPDSNCNQINVDKLKVEADVLEALDHKNIVRYADRKEVNNSIYLVLEYIDGQEMEECFWKKKHTNDEAKWYINQILDALIYMHQPPKCVIHRDLNPKNVMVSNNKELKLIDFGTAKYYYRSMPGMGSNTIVYTDGGCTAPEQKLSGMATFQSDIFSAGGILYFLLTGMLPAFCIDQAGKLKSPLESNPDAGALSDIALKALKSNPDERYQTAQDMKNAILGCETSSQGANILLGGKRYPINDDVIIGAEDDCDIVVPDPDPRGPFISSHHARIYLAKDRYWIEDTNSLNHTYIVVTDSYGSVHYNVLAPGVRWPLTHNQLIVLCYHKALGPYVQLKFQES